MKQKNKAQNLTTKTKKQDIIKQFIDLHYSLTYVIDEFDFKFIYKKVDYPSSFIGFFTRAGSLYEKEEEKGIAHLIEHSVFRGSKNYPSDIPKYINYLGGYTNAYTSYDQTVYYIKLPTYNLDKGLDVLIDMVLNPLFKEEDVNSEKNIIFHEINMRDDEPMVVLFEETMKKIYPSSPIKDPIIGYKETLEKITTKEIREFFEYYQSPNNSFFVIVSNKELDEIKDLIKKSIENKKIKTTKKDLNKVNYKIEDIPKKELEIKGNVNKVYLLVSYYCPTSIETYKEIEEVYYLNIICSMLGGSNYSILNRVLKNELKLADAVSFEYYTTNEIPGIIYFSAITDENKINNLLEKYNEIINEPNQYLDSNYFEVIKENSLSSNFWTFESPASQGMLIGSSELFKTYKEAYEYINKLNKIKFQDLFDIAHKYIINKNPFISKYIPQK
ncbi:MAG: insulinase family protein [bacterium]|nr:insulinase family protein [bacterium]